METSFVPCGRFSVKAETLPKHTLSPLHNRNRIALILWTGNRCVGDDGSPSRMKYVNASGDFGENHRRWYLDGRAGDLGT